MRGLRSDVVRYMLPLSSSAVWTGDTRTVPAEAGGYV